MPSILLKLNPQLDKQLSVLQKKLAYQFLDSTLLQNAILHRSALGPLNQLDSHHGHEDNDRLEFLGDAVLDVVMCDLLMQKYPDHKVGDLSKLRASLVNEAILCELASQIQLEKALVLGPGERPAKPSILADAIEAIIGAVYREGGLNAASTVVKTLFASHLAKTDGELLHHDAKTDLQEWSQRIYGKTPSYQTLTAEGPDHARTFEVGVFLNDEMLGSAKGSSKKSAEQRAALAALTARDQKSLRNQP